MIEPKQLGIKCLNNILVLDAPNVLAAKTNSCCLSWRISPLTILAIPTQDEIAIATIIANIPLDPSFFKTFINNTTYINVGIEYKTSTILIIILSTFPPKKPAIPPYKTPITRFKTDAAKAIINEYLAPYITLTNKSLPKLSVPNQCCAFGHKFEAVLSVDL